MDCHNGREIISCDIRSLLNTAIITNTHVHTLTRDIHVWVTALTSLHMSVNVIKFGFDKV